MQMERQFLIKLQECFSSSICWGLGKSVKEVNLSENLLNPKMIVVYSYSVVARSQHGTSFGQLALSQDLKLDISSLSDLLLV